jgi:predicted nucleic acid-binding protein
MANIYLDTNKVIDLIIRKPELGISLSDHHIYYSPLSAHILFYAARIKVPSADINSELNKILCVSLDSKIIKRALLGPTNDLEDNIQLHSAAEADCDIFLTNDKALLKLGYFGKTKIADHV